jgi:decaprenyl-phosphate phosphoribosyltransferase
MNIGQWRGLVIACRPQQWMKNLVVFGAPVAAGVFFDRDVWWQVVVSFVVFCAASSAVYLTNDVVDVESDRLHPRKMRRPIASGALAPRPALVAAGVLALVAIVGGLLIRPKVGLLIGIYLVLSLVYTAGVKHIAVVDLLIVVSGFVVRAAVGAAAAEVPISQLFLTVLAFGALAMAAGKRSGELARVGVANGSRPVLSSYTPAFLAQVETIAVGGTLLGYALWAFDVAARSNHELLVQLSVAPFATAVLRYALMVSKGEGETPEEAVLADAVLGVAAVAWGVIFVLGVGL